MVAWRRSKMNHSSRTTRRSTDGMLGCLIFSVQPNATFDFTMATAGLVATLATAALGQP